MAAEEGESGQHNADTQCPYAEYSPTLLNAELVCLCLQLTSVACSIVVPEAVGNDLAGRALNHIKDVAADWLDDVSRGKRRGNHVRLLVELGSGQTCACAQPLENGNALGD